MFKLVSLGFCGWLLRHANSLPLTRLSSASPRHASPRPDIPADIISSGLISGSPFIESRIFVDDNVRYSCDLYSCQGANNYVELHRQWYESLLPSLSNARFSVLRVSPLDATRVVVGWNLTFVSESTSGLVSSLGQIPGVRVRFFDILDKERLRSAYSWRSLGRTFGRLLLTGELVLPHAVIVGTSELTFSVNLNQTGVTPFALVAQKDSLNLVRSLDQGILKNRKLTLDLLEFVDASRPPFSSFEEWDDIMVRRLDTRSVPGMGQFDVDGVEGTQEETVERVVSNLLRLAIPIALALLLFSNYVLDAHLLPGSESDLSEYYF